jgi:hypothetical protein
VDTPFSFDWLPRDTPLEPRAVAATGAAARQLALRLLAGPDDALSELRGVAAPGLIVLLGAPDSLPWVDGARYFGQDPLAPTLLMPTTHRPAVAASLVERAFRRSFLSLAAPLLVIPPQSRVVSVADALPVQRAALVAWLEDSP